MARRAGDIVAVVDAMNRPPLARPDGQWGALEPDETACAGPHRPRRRGWRRVAAAAMVLAGLVAFLSPAPAAGPASAAAAAPVPELAWQPCADPSQRGFDCATAQVPLDYGNPQSATIDLAVIGHQATDPANRIGALFFNPGGPGGAGTEDLPAFFNLFPPELRTHFDLISWDPRGIGASTAVQCFATGDDEQRFFAGIPFKFFPVGDAEKRAWIHRYARFGQLCGRRNGDLLAHVSTADSARDLELLRQAVGDPHLNYLGASYGTLLGGTYANLFPDKVRAMVLDGDVDPVAWTNGGEDRTFLSTSLRLGSDVASAKTLNAFLTLCGQTSTDRCAFSAGSAAATQAKWTTLLQRVREHPVPYGEETITYGVLVSAMNAWLTTTEPQPPGQQPPSFIGWTAAAGVLQQLWELSNPDAPLAAANAAAAAILTAGRRAAARRASAGGAQTYEGPEQILAVECAESPNPRNPLVFLALDAIAYARAGDIGPSWLWNDEPCASWPAAAADRYAGPWNQHTANPILVIGNTFDPETPYEGAVAMAHELARAQLLTVDGYGHTALLNPSTCASNYESPYVVDGTLPPPGTVCQQDQQPFTTGP
jgi:pimeloyl-ACP methyl ester carboxylesterase